MGTCTRTMTIKPTVGASIPRATQKSTTLPLTFSGLPTTLESKSTATKLTTSKGDPHKRRTPTAAWKEALRRSCLEKARQRRHIQRVNDAENNTGNNNIEDHHDGCRHERERGHSNPCQSASVAAAEARATAAMSTSAQQLIQEEMKQYRATFLSPCAAKEDRLCYRNNNNDLEMTLESVEEDGKIGDSQNRNCNRQLGMELDYDYEDDHDHGEEHYSMTEDEWIDLIQEVEEELERAQALEFMEQLEERQREEEEYYADQIADFEEYYYSSSCEQQQHHHNAEEGLEYNSEQHAHAESLPVLCPICNEADVTETVDGDLVCPNHMDGSCSFYLTNRHGLDRLALRDALRTAFDDHAEHGCNNPLIFALTAAETGRPSNNNDRFNVGQQQQLQSRLRQTPQQCYLHATCQLCGCVRHIV